MQDLEWLEDELHGGPSRGGRAPNHDAHLAQGGPGAQREVADDQRDDQPRRGSAGPEHGEQKAISRRSGQTSARE